MYTTRRVSLGVSMWARPAGRLGPSLRHFKIITASYRWSNTNGNGRRKRDSLLDNVGTTETPPPPSSADSEADRVTQLRRRREERRKAREAAAANLAGARNSSREEDNFAESPPPPSAWERSEWGPAAPTPPDSNEYGWAEESWAGGSPYSSSPRSGGRRTINNTSSSADDDDDDEIFDGTDEEWEEELLRRERRRRSGAAASTSRNGGARGGAEQEEEEYLYEEEEEEGDREKGGGTRSKVYQEGAGQPDIALLSPQELEAVLPVVPFSAQATYFNGGAAQAVQRWGSSLALTVLLSKIAVLAAGTLTWPLWWPWAQAASKNYSLRKQRGYAGLWRTEILEIELRGRPRPQFGGGGGDDKKSSSARFSTMRTTRIVLGDPDGAQTEFVLPQDARYDLVQPGQPAELIVLSDSPSFESFKAVKDVYLPDCGLWLSEYPFLDRTAFLELSLDIEREAMAMAAEEAWEQERQEERRRRGNASSTRNYDNGEDDDDGLYRDAEDSSSSRRRPASPPPPSSY